MKLFFRFQNGRPALTCCHSATVHLNELQSTFNELFFGGAEGQRLTRRVMASAAIFCRKLGNFFFFLETKSGDPSKAARGGRWVAGREKSQVPRQVNVKTAKKMARATCSCLSDFGGRHLSVNCSLSDSTVVTCGH